MRLHLALQTAALAGMVLSVDAPAQTPESGQTPAGRLEQLDETYSSNLRKYHAPVIQDYLMSLERLKQTLAQRDHSEDMAAVQAEIDRVKLIGTGSGLLPYSSLPPPRSDDKPGAPAPPKPATDKVLKKTGPVGAFIFAAAAAKKSAPDPAALAEKPDGRAVPVGSAEWPIDKIPAGDYHISILYSCAGKPTDCTVVARLGENSIQHALTAANATGGVNEFRIARLGVISLEKDAMGGTLVLQNSDPASAAIWVRQVIVAKQTDTVKK